MSDRTKTRTLRRERFGTFGPLFLSLLLLVALLAHLAVSAMSESCGEWDDAVHSTCKPVKYRDLPPELQNFMAKMKCEVKTGSNYDYGYMVDLNLDGKPEYAFCCHESPHGPCAMTIFGASAGRWKVLYEYLLGFSDDETPCLGFVVLREKHYGYGDVCMPVRTKGVISFKNGKYHDVAK